MAEHVDELRGEIGSRASTHSVRGRLHALENSDAAAKAAAAALALAERDRWTVKERVLACVVGACAVATVALGVLSLLFGHGF